MEDVRFFETSWKVSKNQIYKRYSVIELGDEYYLIDNDRTKWRHAFPVLNWLIPEETMKINLTKREIKQFLLSEGGSRSESKETGLAWGVLLGGPLGMSFIAPILNQLGILLPELVNLVVVCAICSYILIWKRKKSRKEERKLDLIGRENLSKQRMRIVPASISQGVKMLFIFHFIVIGVLFSNFHFIFIDSYESNPVLFLLGAISFSIYLHMTMLLRVNCGRYKVKILDD